MLLHSSRARAAWLVPLLAVVLAAAVLAAGLAAHRWSLAAMARESTLQSALRSTLDDRGGAAAPACAPEVDYAQSLPATVSLDKLVQSLQDGAHAFGATLVSVSGEPRPATAKSLATLSVSIALRGAYPAIKSTLAEGLSRFPTATLQQMHLKRAGTAMPGVEDANLQLVFALRPAAAGPAECRASPVDRDVMESKWQ
jgi:alkylhydroperoxidase/carboxymuconolactone decarboxylase family protein YurZ